MKLENKKMTEEEIKKANEQAVEIAKSMGGGETSPSPEITDYEQLIKEKEKRNEETREKIKKNKLKGNMIFLYTLIDTNDKLRTLSITYPNTSKAIKYQKVLINPETQKAELNFTDMAEDFAKDGLIANFDIDDFELSEIVELSGFLSSVVMNPRLK